MVPPDLNPGFPILVGVVSSQISERGFEIIGKGDVAEGIPGILASFLCDLADATSDATFVFRRKSMENRLGFPVGQTPQRTVGLSELVEFLSLGRIGEDFTFFFFWQEHHLLPTRQSVKHESAVEVEVQRQRHGHGKRHHLASLGSCRIASA